MAGNLGFGVILRFSKKMSWTRGERFGGNPKPRGVTAFGSTPRIFVVMYVFPAFVHSRVVVRLWQLSFFGNLYIEPYFVCLC